MSTIYLNIKDLNELKLRDGMLCLGADEDLQVNIRLPEGWEVLMTYALGLGREVWEKEANQDCDCHRAERPDWLPDNWTNLVERHNQRHLGAV